MRKRSRQRDVEFAVVSGELVRTVRLEDGRSYVHRCTREAYEAVARGIEEHADEGVLLTDLAMAADMPSTQGYVARDFLLERGCIQSSGGRCFPASDVLYEDAMLEFHALAEGADES
jgi:hypothetical protein